MALTTTTRKVIHDGNASATVFAYSFPILEASHLSVIYTDEDDVETTLSASQFSVTGIGGRTGGNVTYPLTGSPIATGTKLTIVRTVPYTQTTVLSNQGGYYPEVVERRFDEIYMAMQQLAEIVGRYTVSSISDPATEQANYAHIQALQAFRGDIDKLTTAGDLLTRDGAGYRRLPRGSSGQFLGISGADAAWQTPAYPAFSSCRQTVSTGPVTTAGLPNFLPATTSGTLALQTSNVSPTYPLVATAASGWSVATGAPVDTIGVSTGPLTWPGLAPNRAAATPNFLYVTIAGGVLTPGSTLLPPIYQHGGTPAVTSGQFTFNIAEMRGYLGNGTSAPPVNLVVMGEAATDGMGVTSTVAYGYNGQYDSGFTSTLPSTSTSVSRSHNLGIVPRAKDIIFECTTANAGFAVSEQVSVLSTTGSESGNARAPSISLTRNTMRLTVTTSSAFLIVNPGAFGATDLTPAAWKFKFIAERGW